LVDDPSTPSRVAAEIHRLKSESYEQQHARQGKARPVVKEENHFSTLQPFPSNSLPVQPGEFPLVNGEDFLPRQSLAE
jgi:hypothetical protein